MDFLGPGLNSPVPVPISSVPDGFPRSRSKLPRSWSKFRGSRMDFLGDGWISSGTGGFPRSRSKFLRLWADFLGPGWISSVPEVFRRSRRDLVGQWLIAYVSV